MAKIHVALALTCALALGGLRPAHAASATADLPVAKSSAASPGTSGNGALPATALTNLEFLGCIPFRVEASTIPALIASGRGILYDLAPSSGTSALAYSVAFDSNSVGVPNGSQDYPLGLAKNGSPASLANIPAGKALTPKIFTGSGAGGAPTANLAYSSFRPRQFASGLIVSNSDAGLDTYGCYRLLNANNPGP